MNHRKPDPTGAVFDQRGQKVGTQYNIAGDGQIKLDAKVGTIAKDLASESAKKESPTIATAQNHESNQGWLASGHQRRYVVFCRILGVEGMTVEKLAGAQQALMDVCSETQKNAALQVSEIHSSVYGRFLCVLHSAPALETARQVLDQAASRGVRLSIGLDVGRLETVDDLGAKNVIGNPVNLAARLASRENAEGTIALTDEVYSQAIEHEGFAADSFTDRVSGKVKLTTFQYYQLIHSVPSIGELASFQNPFHPEAHAVVYDIAGFSRKSQHDQWKTVTELRKIVVDVLTPMRGRSLIDTQQLWYAPGGDGGVLIFAPENGVGDPAWLFAHELARQCHGQVEIRLGIATGSVVVIQGQLPVGPAILHADKLSSRPPSWGICVNQAFWKGLSQSARKGWQETKSKRAGALLVSATKAPSMEAARLSKDHRPAITPAVRAYVGRLKAATAKLELIGLGQGVQIELPIQQAYLPLKVVVAQGLKDDPLGHYSQKELQQREHVDENVPLGDMFKLAKRFNSRGVLLLGDPGAGKTTGARQFCWRMLKETDLPNSLGLRAGALPVFLRLRQITPQHIGQGLQSFITDALTAATLPPALANPSPDLLVRGGVLWVFDGLDEVVNEDARVRVCHWITQMLADHPDDFFLVTSRYQGYQGRVALGPAFCQFHVKPLDENQVAEFVERWYRAVFEKLHGQGADIAQKAGQKITSLLALLRQPEYRIGRLRQLPANPLMLTILCVVHHQDQDLPRRRADLYAKCVRVLVEHWRKGLWQDQAISPYDPEAAEAVLAAVAWWLHGEKNRTTQTVEELGAVATQALADLGPGAGLGRDGVGFIGRMRDQSGILAMWSAGQCGFLHLTFQEYLAGLHAARENRAEELVKNIGASWWREVILVAIAIGSRDFAQKFFAALLETDAVAKQSALVDQCLDEARYAVLEPFLTVLKKPEMAPDRQLAILRPLRPFKHAELTAVCRRLARSAHLELREVAREILQRAGVEPERPTIEILETPLALQVHLKTGIALITIPAGEFVMGSNDGYSDEKPVHCVRISRPFQLGKYPVTNAEYQRFLEANPHTKPPAFWNDSQFNDPQQPVVGVCWHEARAFCQWADGRLPTEAEWEYACRAGSQGHWCFGNDEAKLGEYAWYIQNSGSNLHPVGQKKPNAWGLHDMHGNVWEWCLDGNREYTTEPQLDPVGPLEGAWRVVRGGSCWFFARGCRSAFRIANVPGNRIRFQGFRLAAGQEFEGGAKDSGASGRSRGAEGRSPAEGPESGAG